MQAAKDTINKFTSKHGQHDTTVHESHAPAVTKNEVQHHQHEAVTQAVDREVHQDHYHTSAQHITHNETLPSQHHTKEVPLEHRSHEHGDTDDDKRRVAEQRALYRDEERHVEGKQTQSAEPVVAGEHRHHHVHETVQPIVHKQTVQPHVVHTTAPVHEVHHNKSHHHGASDLPAMTMDEFKNKGGVLTGREERVDHFKGEPDCSKFGQGNIGSSTGTTDLEGGRGLTGGNTNAIGRDARDMEGERRGVSGTTGSGTTSGLGRDARDLEGERRGVSGTTGSGTTSGLGRDARDLEGSRTGASGLSGSGNRNVEQGIAHDGNFGSTNAGPRDTAFSSNNSSSATTDAASGAKKASLMDKLNPKVDSNGDGVAGFMK